MNGTAERPPGASPGPRLLLVATLERFFYWLGVRVARWPFFVIIGCTVICTIFAYGLRYTQQETRPEKLWIPSDAPYVADSEWVRANFPQVSRPELAIFEAENVLTAESLLQVLDAVERVEAIDAKGTTWQSICLKIPVVTVGQNENPQRRRRQTESAEFNFDDFNDFDEEFDEDLFKRKDLAAPSFIKNFDPSIHLDRKIYCSLVDAFPEKCFMTSILELWSYDRKKIASLTPEEIQQALNETSVSPVYGTPRKFEESLGGIERDANGTIKSARSLQILWLVESDPAKAVGSVTNDAGTGEKVAKNILDWEAELVKTLRGDENSTLANGSVMSYVFSGRSFGDISGDTIKNDAQKLSFGFIIMFLFVQLMLGKFNLVEQRALLSAIGVASVGMGCVGAYGLCAMLGVPFGPVHNVLPFLLLGIGIDDMFVIVQSHASLDDSAGASNSPERVGRTLQHAGVAITVTSLTDLAAFAVGASTTLPSLRSFCIYAAVGIVFTYILQVTFFTAWFSLDLRRAADKRDGCFFCFRYKDHKPNACSQTQLSTSIFDLLSKTLVKTPARVLVIIVTAALLLGGSWGTMLLRQEFDPAWFLPPETYLSKFVTASRRYYPADGEPATIYLSAADHAATLPELARLLDQIERLDSVQQMDAWYSPFQSYANDYFNASLPGERMNETRFNDVLGRFIFSPAGSKYRSKFRFKGSVRCTKPAPQILISSFDLKFKKFQGSFEHVPAMNELKRVVAESQFGAGAEMRVWARAFAGWETDEVIASELLRNLCWAMVCVFCTTFLLIADLTTCLLVLGCVSLTLVNVAGYMHWWGLTVDVVSCIDLVLAVGLCVDYAAHVGHAFMRTEGASKAARAQKSLFQIGPAVFNGGFSTFLAFVVLANSDSHVFATYFKIFFLVVVFGLFHGLLLLPVVLSLIGPAAYPDLTGHASKSKPKNVVSAASVDTFRLKETEGLKSLDDV